MIEKGDYPSALRVVKNENSREALIKVKINEYSTSLRSVRIKRRYKRLMKQ